MDNPDHDRRWLILAVLGIAQLMVVLDVTIVNIALPSAQKGLGFSNDNRQFGRKWTFIVGLAGFALASAVGGAAQSFGVLVAARATQGMFGAILAPAALSLLTTTFSEGPERGKAFGIFGALAGGGGAVGLLLGGFLTEYLSWRWCLYVNLFFAAAAIAGASVLLSNQNQPDKPCFDLAGTLTGSVGLFALVYGFSNAARASWTDPVTLVMLALGIVLLTGFVLVERRVANPLLPLRIVLDRDRGGSYLAVVLSAIAIFAVFLFITYYLQQNLRFSPVQAGLAFLPMVAMIMTSSITANVKLLARTGARPLVPTGMLLGAAGMLYLTGLGPHSSYAGHVLPALIVLGLGFGVIFAPALQTATLGVARNESGIASAMVNTSQQVGGSIGLALLSTIAITATRHSLAAQHPTPALVARATVHGYTTAFYVSAAIFALGVVITGLLLRSKSRTPIPASEPSHELTDERTLVR